jgi:competence protein ComEC
MARLAVAWRFAALGGIATGVAASPLMAADPGHWRLIGAGLGATLSLAVARPRARSRVVVGAWLCLLALSGATVGLGIGVARLAAIDAGALDLRPGQRATVYGHVAAVPRRTGGEVRVRVDTPDGRLMVKAPEPVPDLPVGATVRARGTIRDPGPWEAGWLRRLGVRDLLSASEIELTGGRRGGTISLLDGIRVRAEDALGRGIDPGRAALLRGFVLGQDDRIDAGTVNEFRRSGLAHLLAVSGQNVVLLALLAWPLLALLGLGLRARLLATLVLIALYVPVAGGGASIQRAGIMGAAGVIAVLAGRPRSRWYVVLLSVAATLMLNPRASGDAGWQLSFAAVVGIMLWARPLRAVFLGEGTREPRGPPAGSRRSWVRTALADGAAVTVAATLATAPLMATQFGAVSVASLPANLLALPAVAPVMWLGMLAGLAGQLPGLPVEPLTWVAGQLAGYVAQIARWLSGPTWAQVQVDAQGPTFLIVTYATLALAISLALRWAGRRGAMRVRTAVPAGIAIVAVATAIALVAGPPAGDLRTDGTPGMRVTVLDVGQGDSILLEPRDGDPVLVDAGPAEADVATQLADRGVERLAAVIATHPQVDHIGGVPGVLSRIATARLLFADADRSLLGAALAAGAKPHRIATGTTMHSGSLRVEVLWPPAALERARGQADDPNLRSLIVLARWHRFEILLAGDAEAETARIDPGPIDVLKVAHHGSEDAGLDRLLDTATPRLAVISVGADNPYGHPAPATLEELREHGVTVARTDLAGALTIDVDSRGFRLEGSG